MGNTNNNNEDYESNKVNIILCGDISTEINKLIINSLFENASKN